MKSYFFFLIWTILYYTRLYLLYILDYIFHTSLEKLN